MTPAELDLAKADMLGAQLRGRGIHDPRVLDAMARVPRERFIDPEAQDQAYADRAMAIRCGQTISQPYIVALMSQALRCSGREKILEVGTGSGYQTAVLAELARQVISIERHAELTAEAKPRLSELGYRNLTLLVGDGTLGWPGQSPYDRIIVTAATAQCPPALVEQLVEGGILVIPIGGSVCQTLQAIQRIGDRLLTTDLTPCRFVPLVGAQGWPEDAS